VLLREPDRSLDALGGYYVAPAIFADVPADVRAEARERSSGRCSPACRPRLQEALAIATGLDYALTGASSHGAGAAGTRAAGVSRRNLY